MRAGEIAIHGAHQGATVALTIAQVRFGHELRWLQPDFANIDDHHDLVVSFEGAIDAVVNASSVKGIVNNIFFGP